MEPTNPDRYYVIEEVAEYQGKRGKMKLKKWTDLDTGELKQKILSFEPFAWEEE